MSAFRYRLVDTSGSEIGIVSDERSSLEEGDAIELQDGTPAVVVEVYDDEFGREGGVEATLVVDEG
jgi:urease accessory protein UreE